MKLDVSLVLYELEVGVQPEVFQANIAVEAEVPSLHILPTCYYEVKRFLKESDWKEKD